MAKTKWQAVPSPTARKVKISKNQLAAALGVSVNTITKEVNDETIAPDDKGAFCIADITIIMRGWMEHDRYVSEVKTYETPAETAERKRNEAAAANFESLAENNRITIRARSGELLSAESIARLLGEAFATMRVQVSALPESILPLVSGKADAQRLARKKMDKIINTTLRDAADDVEKIVLETAARAEESELAKIKKK